MGLFKSQKSVNEGLFNATYEKYRQKSFDLPLSGDDLCIYHYWLFCSKSLANNLLNGDKSLMKAWGEGSPAQAAAMCEVCVQPMISMWYGNADTQASHSRAEIRQAKKLAISNILHLFGTYTDIRVQHFFDLDQQYIYDTTISENKRISLYYIDLFLSKLAAALGYQNYIDWDKQTFPVKYNADFHFVNPNNPYLDFGLEVKSRISTISSIYLGGAVTFDAFKFMDKLYTLGHSAEAPNNYNRLLEKTSNNSAALDNHPMNFCPNCGSKIGQTAKFCRECGCDLKLDDTEQLQPNENTPIQKCARHPKLDVVGVCAECGVGVCVVCKSGVKDKLYCPNCIGGDVQHSSNAIGGLVKDKHIQHDLDWLQAFKKQYEEVVQLSLELQSIAKGIPLTPHEADNQLASGIGEQFKELQIKFANLEKSLGGGPKPKSSDLGRMNRSLQNACVYYGVACVAYRKWAEQPSSSIEAYTTERLEKAGKSMDKVNEQLALFFNKPVAAKDDAIRDDLKVNQESKPRKQRFKWVRKHPHSTVILVWISLIVLAIPSLIFVPPLGFALFLLVVGVYIFGIFFGAVMELKRKGQSLWGLIYLLLGWFPGFIIIKFLLTDFNFLPRILTKEQMDSGLYLERDGERLYLKKENADEAEDEILDTFFPKITSPEYIRAEAQKYINPSGG